MFGVGTVDKHRAIHEVKTRSKIGLLLIEIELRLIDCETQAAQTRLQGDT